MNETSTTKQRHAMQIQSHTAFEGTVKPMHKCSWNLGDRLDRPLQTKIVSQLHIHKPAHHMIKLRKAL